MTAGEIWAILWARSRFDDHADAQEQLYQDLLEATSE